MTYEEALKKVQNKKNKSNYILVELSYDKKIVLPYKDGLALLACIENAEQLADGYSVTKSITPLDRSAIKVEIMSQDYYEKVKIAALLNVSISDLEKYESES